MKFETKFDNNQTTVICKLNNRSIEIAKYDGEPDDYVTEDMIIAYQERTLLIYDARKAIRTAQHTIQHYKDKAYDESHDDACVDSLKQLNQINDFIKQQFQYDSEVALSLAIERCEQQIQCLHRFDLILDQWQQLTLEQMYKTNPIEYAWTVYKLDELDEDELKDLLYQMYQIFKDKLDNQ